jgi:hypothetical protein
MRQEVYVSTDVEADGPIPGPNSMLSFGSVAYLADRTRIATFSANLDLLSGASADPVTMEWWARHGEAWNACRQDPRPPELVMPEYAAWLDALPGKPVFVGYPAPFDFMFIYWYLVRFAKRSPFGFAALDLKTMAMVLLGKEFQRTTKDTMPRSWFNSENPHRHVALDDAIEQGELFLNMLEEARRLRAVPW